MNESYLIGQTLGRGVKTKYLNHRLLSLHSQAWSTLNLTTDQLHCPTSRLNGPNWTTFKLECVDYSNQHPLEYLVQDKFYSNLSYVHL